MKKLLFASLLMNILGAGAVVLFHYGNSMILYWGPSASFYSNGGSYVEASGMLVAGNYKPGYPIQLYSVRCENLRSSKCIAASAVFNKGYLLSPIFEDIMVAEWTNSRIVGVQDFSCRKQYWIFDLLGKTVHLESVYKPPTEQRGDCSGFDTDTRKSKLADWEDALKLVK